MDRIIGLSDQVEVLMARGRIEDLGLGKDAPAGQKRRWEELWAKLQDVQEELEGAPTRVTWSEMVRETEREAFDYGPKTVNDLIRVVAVNAEHSIRDVIREDYPNPRHERPLARMLLQAPGTYQVVGHELRITVRPPDRRRRFAQAAKHVVDLLSSLGLPHPLQPALTLRWSLGPPV